MYLPHTDKHILHSRLTSIDQSEKARWKWHTAKRIFSFAHCQMTWRQCRMELQTSHSKQYTIHGHMFALPWQWCFEVLVRCVWPCNRCSWCVHEASSFVDTSQGCIKNGFLVILQNGSTRRGKIQWIATKITLTKYNFKFFIRICNSGRYQVTKMWRVCVRRRLRWGLKVGGVGKSMQTTLAREVNAVARQRRCRWSLFLYP